MNMHVNMSTKPVTKITAVLFAIGAMIHLCRLLFGWKVMIAGVMLPLWASLVVIPVAAVFAFMLMREART